MFKRINIRISGLGGQGAVTAAHLLAMAANNEKLYSISNPFFGAEKRMAPAESYVRIGIERIYDREFAFAAEVFFQISFCIQLTNQSRRFTLRGDRIGNRCADTRYLDRLPNHLTACHKAGFSFGLEKHGINVCVSLAHFILGTQLHMLRSYNSIFWAINRFIHKITPLEMILN